MTAQAPDRIVLDGEELPLFANPLEDYFEATGEESPLFSSWTNLWRGYVASWSIENGVLYLTAVNGGDPYPMRTDGVPVVRSSTVFADAEETPIGMAELFPGRTPPIEASWYSGTLRVGRGAILYCVHMSYDSVFEHEEHLGVRAGRVISRRRMDGYEVLQCRAEAMMREAAPQLRRGGLTLVPIVAVMLLLGGTGLIDVHWVFSALFGLALCGLVMTLMVLYGTLARPPRPCTL